VDGVNFILEAHNPTDEQLTVTVTGAPGFAPLKGYQEALTLQPHQSIKVSIPSVPETVRLVPLKY
jgi:hypothetical protein